MLRTFVVALTVAIGVAAAVAAAPALVAGRSGARQRPAAAALPGWAARLANRMFAPIGQSRRPRHAPTVIVPPPQVQGTTCYAAGGSVCSNRACARYAGAHATVDELNGAAMLAAPSCTRPAKPLLPKVVPVRMP